MWKGVGKVSKTAKINSSTKNDGWKNLRTNVSHVSL